MNYRIETKEKIHDSERNEMQVENKSAQTHNLNAVKMLDSPHFRMQIQIHDSQSRILIAAVSQCFRTLLRK